ncbi:MAG: hypothetical protein ACOY0R_16965 [Chloroflexota bacterium]
MTRTNIRKAEQRAAPKGPHPIWNGLGCLMMIVIPVMSLGISMVALDFALGQKWPVPYMLLGYPRFPDLFYSTKGLANIFVYLRGIEHLYAYITLTALISILLGGFIAVLYALIYRYVGPSKYGPTDSPPIKLKVSKKQR